MSATANVTAQREAQLESAAAHVRTALDALPDDFTRSREHLDNALLDFHEAGVRIAPRSSGKDWRVPKVVAARNAEGGG